MLAAFPILFAAPWNELVSVLVGLVFLVIWVINQINDARKKQAAEAGRPVDVPLEPMEAAAPQAGAPGGGQADPLRAQVDEFLRRAGQQPKPPAPPRHGPRKTRLSCCSTSRRSPRRGRRFRRKYARRAVLVLPSQFP